MRLTVQNYTIEAKDEDEGIFYSDGRGNDIHVEYTEIESPEFEEFNQAYFIVFRYAETSRDAFAFTFGDDTDWSKARLLALKDFTDAMIKRKRKLQDEVTALAATAETFSVVQERAKNGMVTPHEYYSIKEKVTDIRRHLDPPSNPSNSIYHHDFIIFDGNATWNFIDKYKEKDHAWYEFYFGDTDFQVFSKGLTVQATMDDVISAFSAAPDIDNDYDYSEDNLYIWSHQEDKFGETLNLPICDTVIRYHLNCYEGYDYTLAFYFRRNRLLIVGYTKDKSNGNIG